MLNHLRHKLRHVGLQKKSRAPLPAERVNKKAHQILPIKQANLSPTWIPAIHVKTFTYHVSNFLPTTLAQDDIKFTIIHIETFVEVVAKSSNK